MPTQEQLRTRLAELLSSAAKMTAAQPAFTTSNARRTWEANERARGAAWLASAQTLAYTLAQRNAPHLKQIDHIIGQSATSAYIEKVRSVAAILSALSEDVDLGLSTTPIGLLRFAREYAAAAALVADAKPKMHNPAYFLAGHSIELSLKAFLMKRGVPYAKLRSPKEFGHNLSKLLKEARRRRIGAVADIDRSVDRLLPLLNAQYASKRFEYIRTGHYRVPEIERVTFFALHLSTALQSYCSDRS